MRTSLLPTALGSTLRTYFRLAFLGVLALDLRNTGEVQWSSPLVLCFTALALTTYAFLHLAPARLLTEVSALLLRPIGARASAIGSTVVAALGVAATAGILVADHAIFELYGFHLNGFVWNLITTEGGIDSLGSGASTMRSVLELGLLLLGAQPVLLWVARAWARRTSGAAPLGVRARLLRVAVVAAVAATTHVGYGICMLRGRTDVVLAAETIPFFRPLTFRHLARRWGVDSAEERSFRVPKERSRLDYPLHPVELTPPERPLNLVWLVSESFRADALDPQITPALWNFAARHTRFTHHYSGGNGTRMGMFSMFYGLHGAYWFSFLRERRGPVLIDALCRQDYQMSLYTSAAFTYPEFDSTLFSEVPSECLTADSKGFGWERDRRNVGRMIEFLRERDRSRPFFTFLFFESPHAPYNFPPESVVRTPYAEDMDYVRMDLEGQIGAIQNRYWNACHHLDSQMGRVLDELEQQGLLDSTVVVITGDHGEEFLEAGRWGHNSAFSEPQMRVPLVLALPGDGPAVVERKTSHLDLPATLLPKFGVHNPPEDLSLGQDLLSPQEKPFLAICDWDRIAYRDEEWKIVLPLGSRSGLAYEVHHSDDRPVDDERAVMAERTLELGTLMQELGRFRR